MRDPFTFGATWTFMKMHCAADRDGLPVASTATPPEQRFNQPNTQDKFSPSLLRIAHPTRATISASAFQVEVGQLAKKRSTIHGKALQQ